MKGFSFYHSFILQRFVETVLYRVACLGMMSQCQGLCSQEDCHLLEKTENKLTVGRRAEAKHDTDKEARKAR